MWTKPEGGLHLYLVRFLGSSDQTFQHIAVWSIVQLLESNGQSPSDPSYLTRSLSLTNFFSVSPFADDELFKNIKNSPLLLPLIRQLAEAHHSAGGRGSDDGDASEEGEGADEISALSQRILDLTDELQDGEGEGEGDDEYEQGQGLGLQGVDGAEGR